MGFSGAAITDGYEPFDMGASFLPEQNCFNTHYLGLSSNVIKDHIGICILNFIYFDSSSCTKALCMLRMCSAVGLHPPYPSIGLFSTLIKFLFSIFA